VSTSITPLPDYAVLEVRPGDQEAATDVEGWLQAYMVDEQRVGDAAGRPGQLRTWKLVRIPLV
jgi:hypothetical protein